MKRIGLCLPAMLAAILALAVPPSSSNAAPATAPGSLVLFGNSVKGPFDVQVHGQEVTINGYHLHRGPQQSQSAPTRVEPGTQKKFDLGEVVRASERRQFKRGSDAVSVADSLVALFRASPLVESAVRSGSGHVILLKWRDSPWTEHFLVEPPHQSPDPQIHLERDASTLRDLLARGGVVLVGDRYRILVPGTRAAEVKATIEAVRHGRAQTESSAEWQRLGVAKDILNPVPLQSLKAE